jgi:hypothetical protein
MQMPILLFGIIEMVIGFSGALLADFFSVFDLLTILSGVAGLAALVFCCLNFNKIKVYDLLAMAMVLGYGTGTLNTLLSFTLDGLDIQKIALVEEYWNSLTLGLVTASAGVLHVIGRFHKTSALFQSFELCADEKYRALLLIVVIFSAVIISIATGGIGFMGETRIKGYMNISPIASIISFMILPVSVLAFYLGLKEDSRILKHTLILLSALLLLVTFAFGRRVFVISTIIYLMIFFGNIDQKKLLSLKSLAIAVFLLILINIMTNAFSAMRIASNSMPITSSKNTIVELIPKTIDVYLDSDRLGVDDIIHANLSSRTFVLGYLALLVKASSKFEPIHGEDFLRALIISMPGIFYPSKYKLLNYSEEQLFNLNFRTENIRDAAGSIATAGVGDFGIYGLFAYPLILCIAFSVFLRFINRLISPVKYFFISMMVCYSFISLEQDIAGFILIFRNLLFVLFILWLFFNFNSKKFTNTTKSDYEDKVNDLKKTS